MRHEREDPGARGLLGRTSRARWGTGPARRELASLHTRPLLLAISRHRRARPSAGGHNGAKFGMPSIQTGVWLLSLPAAIRVSAASTVTCMRQLQFPPSNVRCNLDCHDDCSLSSPRSRIIPRSKYPHFPLRCSSHPAKHASKASAGGGGRRQLKAASTRKRPTDDSDDGSDEDDSAVDIFDEAPARRTPEIAKIREYNI